MTDKKVTEMTEDTDPALSDLLYGVKDPDGTPVDRKMSIENVLQLAKLGNLVDRGELSAVDFDEGDMTFDGTWNELDLSSIVPAGSTWIYLSVAIKDGTAGRLLSFRPQGSSASGNWAPGPIRVLNTTTYTYSKFLMAVGSSRIIEYNSAAGTDEVDITVLGWIFDSSPTVLGFSDKLIDRGDPATHDFDEGDLTTDGTWRELNLSSIVPAGATWAYLKCIVQDNVAGSYFQFRKKGSSNDISCITVRTQVDSVNSDGQWLVPLGPDRIVEYRGINLAFVVIYITVLGWVMGSAEQALDYAPNDLINPEFAIWQEGNSIDSTTTPANSDDTYIADQWILLSDGNDIADVSRGSSSPPTGSLYFLHSEVETINKKYGFLQPIEAANSAKYAGDKASLSFQTKGTVDNIRAAIISWDGTADTITSDVVSAWAAEGTNPTLATNWTYENTPANIALSTTWVEHQIENIEIDTSGMTNLAIFFWVDDTDGGLTETFQLGKVKLELNSVCTKFMPLLVNEEVAKCLRYFQKSYDLDTAPGAVTTNGCMVARKANLSTTVVNLNSTLMVTMRIVPTGVPYSPNSGTADVIYNGTEDVDEAAHTAYEGQNRIGIALDSADATDDWYRAHYTLSARL